MASKRSFPRTPRLSLGQQRAQMMAVWPGFNSVIESGALIVRGIVHPSPVTRAYKVRVTYRDFRVPNAFVVSPALERRASDPNTPIPHTYDALSPGRERPCLYCPSNCEWTSRMPLATSVMPWLLAWLVDYEIWYATGEWLGGGVAHTGPKGGDDSPPDQAAA